MAEILHDVSLEAPDHLGTDSLISPYHFAELFGVQLRGEGGRIDQVTKQYRELAAFTLGSRAPDC